MPSLVTVHYKDAERDPTLAPYVKAGKKRLLAHRSFLDFIPTCNRNYLMPYHLMPVIQTIERTEREAVNKVIATPPRHAKTVTLLCGAVWKLKRNPTAQIAYVTYEADTAKSKSLLALEAARNVELGLASESMGDWRTKAGGRFFATGVLGPLTGHGFDLMIVDDPIKNRLEAESPTYRRRLEEWFDDVAFTRIEPGGSCIVNMTRWHEKDLAGRLIADGWEYIRLPAICDSADDPNGRNLGDALWPEKWPVDELTKKRRNEYTWASLFQGNPRPRGNKVFRDAYYYDKLPDSYTISVGLDMAYTAKTQADWSVAIVLLRGVDGKYYLADLIREQVEAPQFVRALDHLYRRWPGAPIPRWHFAGAEKGVSTLMGALGRPIHALPAIGDKFIRSQELAADWNAGKVLLPQHAPWVEGVIERFGDFTGTPGDIDDEIDALASAHGKWAEDEGWSNLDQPIDAGVR